MNEDLIGRRLRAERERRGITLESIAIQTKISAGLLRDLERDDVSRWPPGIFRRSFLKSYAEVVGLDPDEALRAFLQCHPEPIELFVHAPAAEPSTGNGRPKARTPLRLTLAEESRVFSAGPLLHGVWPRLGAAALDAGATLALGGFSYLLIGMFWVPFGLAMLCYYVGGILALGNTPGVCLFAPSSNYPAPPNAGASDESALPDLGHLEESLIR
jgi:transcriptional regulator with XRE-family HTH domain